tara:strand:+ start:920 stop:1804 length:885 start_codon:yes stop_codon:yes gene_type:complete
MPRSENGSTESQRLKWLVNDWNIKLQNNDLSLSQMFSSVNIDTNMVDKFVVAGGSTNHFDIIILMKDGRTINIEHKAITETENNPEHPWSLSSIPQLINGPYNFTDLSIIYCNVWYNLVMPELKTLFPTLPELPSYTSWLKCDASMGSVKTEFGKALKEIRKADKENAYLIDKLYKDSIKMFWKNILENNPEILEQFKQDLLTKMQHCLSQKHLWLNAHYTTSKSIETSQMFLTVTPQISNLSIDINTNEDSHKYPKITLNYNLSSNPNKKFQGQALLRWGNGNGIANIRWNIS